VGACVRVDCCYRALFKVIMTKRNK
jgi:hypothetical protein